MIDFSKIDEKEFAEFKNMIQKSTEKSEFDKFPLFSTDKFVKARLFVLGFRFLYNAYNLLEENSSLKLEVEKELKELEEVYDNLNYYLDILDNGRKYGRHLITEKLFYEINNSKVLDLIDIYAILTERVSIINMSRFKGVVMEGKSGDEFNKIMSNKEE